MGNTDTGYIKIHRSITDWGWYTDGNTMRVFFHLLLRANWQDKEWKGIKVNRGSLVTSRHHLAEELNLSEQEIRTAIEHLESTNEITKCSYPKFTVITVVKYNDYQTINQQGNQQVTNNQPASNQQVTTTKEIKKDKKGRIIPKPPKPGWEFVDTMVPQSMLDHQEIDGWILEDVDGFLWAHRKGKK